MIHTGLYVILVFYYSCYFHYYSCCSIHLRHIKRLKVLHRLLRLKAHLNLYGVNICLRDVKFQKN